MQQEINLLLDEVAFKIGTLREARKHFSDQLAPEFRIFDYLRTDEMGLSQCIASLLDPNEKHGQGGAFLESFLEKFCLATEWSTNTEHPLVTTEEQANGQRRIDIYLKFQNGSVIGIENKPWAGDQDQQLTDYAAYLKKSAGSKNWLLIYLSNYDPSENSIKKIEREELEKNGQYIRLSYAKIIEWLEICACKSKPLVVRIFIEELAKFIRMNINGELDMSEEKEINNVILKSSASLSSAFQVFKAMEGVKKDLLKKFRHDLEVCLESHGLILDWDLDSWQAYKGFNIQFSERPQNLNLRFEFDRTSMYQFFWGIAKKNPQYNNPHVWKAINELMSAKFGSTKWSPHWPWYSDLPDHEFCSEMKNWWVSDTPWKGILDGSLAIKISDLAVRVREVFNTENQFQILFENDSTVAP